MSYSSCGEAVGGKVASCVPPAPVLRAGGGNCDGVIGPALAIGAFGCAGAPPDSVERSSGAPTSRPPGAPIGGSLSTFCAGAASARPLPSTRGAPGEFGRRAGSNTSERPPGALAAGGGLLGTGGDTARGTAPGDPPREPSCWKRYSVSSCMRLSCACNCWF